MKRSTEEEARVGDPMIGVYQLKPYTMGTGGSSELNVFLLLYEHVFSNSYLLFMVLFGCEDNTRVLGLKLLYMECRLLFFFGLIISSQICPDNV